MDHASGGGLCALKKPKKGDFGGFRAVRRYPTHREKTGRAVQACLDLIDTAKWLESELRAPLDSFGLTLAEFRVLELLNRAGPMTVSDVAQERKCARQNLIETSKPLERRGWVRRVVGTLPPVSIEQSHKAKSNAEKRKGRRVGVMTLTPSGKRFVRDVIPNQFKMMKALLRVLDGREQRSLSRLCGKLASREAVLKFLGEIRMIEEDQQEVEVRQKAAAELERLTARMRASGREFRLEG